MYTILKESKERLSLSMPLHKIQNPSCAIYDPLEYFDLSGKNSPLQLQFTISSENVGGFSLSITPEAREWRGVRLLKFVKLNYNGPILKLNKLANPRDISAIIRVSQTINSETVESKNCKVYPNDEYKSYGDCDQKYVLNKFKEQNMIPFWVTSKMAEVTNQRFVFEKQN